MSSERILFKGLRISDAIVTSVGGELVVGARVVAARDEQRVELKIANHLLHVLHPSRLDLDAIELGKHVSGDAKNNFALTDDFVA